MNEFVNNAVEADVLNQTPNKKPCKTCKNTKNNVFVLSSSMLILITSIYGGYKIIQNIYQWITH